MSDAITPTPRDAHGNPIINGQALKPEINWEFDGEKRIASLAYRAPLAIEVVKIGLPFLMLKEAACQILIFEADMAAMVCERAGKEVPKGVRAKKHAAMQLHQEIELEKMRVRKGEQPDTPTELGDGPGPLPPASPEKPGMGDVL